MGEVIKMFVEAVVIATVIPSTICFVAVVIATFIVV